MFKCSLGRRPFPHWSSPEGGVGLGWVGSRPHPDLRDHGHRPSLRVTTGPAGSRLSGLKAYQTDDRPRTPRWHTQEGDAAVPVCVGKCVAWCSRPRWGGWRSLTLSPPGELSAWTRHLQVYRHAAGRPLLPMAGGGHAPHTTGGGLHSLIALARVVLLEAGPAFHGDGAGGWRGPGARRALPCPGVHPGQRSGRRCNCPRKRGDPEGTPPE